MNLSEFGEGGEPEIYSLRLVILWVHSKTVPQALLPFGAPARLARELQGVGISENIAPFSLFSTQNWIEN